MCACVYVFIFSNPRAIAKEKSSPRATRQNELMTLACILNAFKLPCVCVCVCVCKRERVCVRESDCEREKVLFESVRERKRARVYVCAAPRTKRVFGWMTVGCGCFEWWWL